LFRSRDEGFSWERLKIPHGEFIIRIHPKAPDVILAANYSGGVYRSIDEGDTWERIHIYPWVEDGFYDMEFHPADPSMVYAISYYHGLFKSIDGGQNWTAKNSGLNLRAIAKCCIDTPQLEIDPNDGRILYVLMPARKVYKTTDGGESWKSSSSGLLFSSPVHALEIDPKNPSTLYAGGVNGVYRTTDGGATWKSQSCKCSVRSLSINPENPDILYGVGEGAFKTRNKGKSWDWFSPHPFITSIFLSIAVHPSNPNLIFAGGFGSGISRSENGGDSWQISNERLDALNVVRLVAHPKYSGRLLALAGQQVYFTGDGGRTWDLPMRSRSSAFYFSDIAIHPRNPRLIVAVGSRNDKPGAFVFSTDGGSNWEAGKHFYGVNYGCGRCVALDPQDQDTVYLAPFDKRNGQAVPLGVAKSTDFGKSWKVLDNGLTAKDVWVITIHPRNTSRLIAGTGTGKLFVSENGGQNWMDRSDGLDYTSVRSIAVHPSDTNILYVATYKSVFKSMDSGQTWIPITDGLPDAWYNFVEVDSENPQHLYVAGQAGIFVSRDAGETWSPFQSNGLGPFSVWNFIVDPTRRNLFYAGTDRGVFRLESGS
jgi:photosystem II stability/assembly factor-like uncharacterized protein